MKKRILLLTLSTLLLFVGCNNTKKTKAPKYSISDITSKQIDTTKDITTLSEDVINDSLTYRRGLSEINLPHYSKLMQYLDKEVGGYSIYDLYENQYTSPTDQITDYVLTIVPDSYKQDYQDWKGDPLFNPYLIPVSAKINKENKEAFDIGRYNAFIAAEKWTKELNNDFTKSHPNYHHNINYSFLRNYGALSQDWNYLLESIDFNKNDMNQINIFIPYDTGKDQARSIVESMQPILKKFFIKDVKIYGVKTYEDIKSKELIDGNNYEIDRSFKIKYHAVINKDGSVYSFN